MKCYRIDGHGRADHIDCGYYLSSDVESFTVKLRAEITKLQAEREELQKTNVYFARVIKQAGEEYLSSNGCPPEWWTIPLMHEIKELLGILTQAEDSAALAEKGE